MSLSDLRPRWMRELERLAQFKTQIYIYGNIKDTMLYPLGPDQDVWTLGSMREALFEFFRYRIRGYEIIASYNYVDGMQFADMADANLMAKQYSDTVANAEKCQPKPPGGRVPHPIKLEGPIEHALQQMRLCLSNREKPCVFLIEHASQLIREPMHLEFAERASLLRLLKASSESQQVPVKDGEIRRVVQNLLILLCDKQADLPPWLYLNNPFTGSIEVETPRSYERRHFFELFMAPPKKAEAVTAPEGPKLACSEDQRAAAGEEPQPVAAQETAENTLDEAAALEVRLVPATVVAVLPTPEEVVQPDTQPKVETVAQKPEKETATEPELSVDHNELVDLTDGMTIRDLVGIRAVARRPENGALNGKALVDCYKYGIRESEWDNLSWDKLKAAEETLSNRVIGQPAAVTAVADMVRRARLHLSGAQHSSRSKPRGVLFFAGPTGVGKTEMAKALAEMIFASEDACLRFDMSEYSLAHADQRLLGAPPGYLGYEEGGQLTNHVRQNPFSVLLFDEIEKAHPSILDKFLQILEDGRMTDGRGETVYFSESIIIFTSNIGIYQLDQSTGRPLLSMVTGKPMLNVDPDKDVDYDRVREKIIGGVHAYFKHFLGRPELLNRIGQNVIVFDFIRTPVMRQIMERKVLTSIRNQVQDRWHLQVDFAPEVVDELMAIHGGDVSVGGRGMGNLAETAVLNPLARVMFELLNEGEILEGKLLNVTGIVAPSADNGYRYGITWSLDHGA